MIERDEHKTESDIFGSAIAYWFIALVAYGTLFVLINWLIYWYMQPPAPPLANGWMR
ncbi:MAG: hypothetical protein WCE94_12495 [Candidatus Methanoperedens sp.]